MGRVSGWASAGVVSPAENLTSDQLLGLEEALQMLHLPEASEDEDESLGDGPPQNPLVGALTGHTETLLSVLQGTDRQTHTQTDTHRYTDRRQTDREVGGGQTDGRLSSRNRTSCVPADSSAPSEFVPLGLEVAGLSAVTR